METGYGLEAVERAREGSKDYLETRIRSMHKEKPVNDKKLFEHKMKRRRAEIRPLGYVPIPF